MIIPKLRYISQGSSPQEHLENIQKACTSGVELVQLGIKNISEKKLLKIATEARAITSHFQTRLLITGAYKIAKTIKADGVYLEDTAPCPTLVRTHLYSWQIIGGAAHTLQDCEKLLAKDVDYLSLGPFRVTSTTNNNQSNNPDIGLKGYTAIMDVLKTETPIMGFGGITTEDITEILETGISGVAVGSRITQNFNAIKTFNQLLKASATAEQRHSFK